MGIFQEYMDSKGHVKDAVVDIHGDRTDPMTAPTKPPGKGQKPYVSSNGKSKKGSKEKGFGDQGDHELVFKYDTEKPSEKKSVKIPTVEQRFMYREVLPLLRESVTNDPLMVEDMILDFKRNGLLHLLVAEMLQHRETYKHMTELMKHEEYGPEICRKLHNAMSEEVSAPFHVKIDDDPEDLADTEEIGAEEGDDMDMGMGDENLGNDDMDFDMSGADGMGDGMDLDDGMGLDGEFDGFPDDQAPEDLEGDDAAFPHPMSGPEMLALMKKFMGKK